MPQQELVGRVGHGRVDLSAHTAALMLAILVEESRADRVREAFEHGRRVNVETAKQDGAVLLQLRLDETEIRPGPLFEI